MTEEGRLLAAGIRFGILPWTSPPFLLVHEFVVNIILSGQFL
jgi:hypothetical protein